MTDAFITCDERQGIALVRLNRPEKLNALTPSMLDRLTHLFHDVAARNDLRAVILIGTSTAFCAGTDISGLSQLTEEEARSTARRGQEACDAIENCSVPVIAAVGGAAIGGGCELALACHLRVAARTATFTLPEIHLGLLPAYGGTQRLARLVGRGRALAVMLAGDKITADEAHRLGLVNRIAEDGETLAAAEALATQVSGFAPLAVRACLRAVVQGARLDFERGLELEAELFSELFATEDVREGTSAFLEKRAPVFKGR